MTNSHHSLYLEWCDAVGATYSNRQNLWSQFSSAQIHPLSNPWLEISPEVLEKVNSELSDSRYVDHLDKLGKMWLCLGSRVQAHLSKHGDTKHLYVHGASARAHDDAYLQAGIDKSSKVLVSPMTTPSAALNCVAKELESPHMTKLTSATCVSFAAALEDFMVHRDHSPDAGFFLMSGECVSHPYKIKMYQNLGVYHSGSNEFFNQSYSKDRAGMLLADGSSAFLFRRNPTKNTSIQVLDICMHRDPDSTLTGVATSDFLSHKLDSFLVKNQCEPSDIDFIVGHGSATKKGDAAEVEAYQKTFSSSIPPLLSTKWLTGHLLGGSMGASFVLASQIIETQKIPSMPYELMVETRKTKLSRDSHFLIVGLGFNGQVACILGKGV